MLNRVMLIGNLGADPELSYTPAGTAKVTIRLATVSVWYNNDGEKQEKTTWHRLIGWGKRAELYAQYLTKGSLIHVEGRIDNRSWETKDGRRYTSEVVIEDVKFLILKDGTVTADEEAPELPVVDAEPDDDIPF